MHLGTLEKERYNKVNAFMPAHNMQPMDQRVILTLKFSYLTNIFWNAITTRNLMCPGKINCKSEKDLPF